nr:hypothetical protein [Hymenobacter volaticus]
MAWLTALRYQLRSERPWESKQHKHNVEYQQYYTIPEQITSLECELTKYLTEHELKLIVATKNKATHLLSLQSQTIKDLYDLGQLGVVQFVEMQRTLKEFYLQQGQSEQLKESPYPDSTPLSIHFSCGCSAYFCLSACSETLIG